MAINEGVTEHFGMCDASAAVALSSSTFITANDEDNILRVYAAHQSGLPIQAIDISEYLIPESKGNEADIEGSAILDGKIFWITSHGRNKKGRVKPSRYQFFATEVTLQGSHASIEIVGHPYTQLQRDLLEDTQLNQYQLKDAAQLPPKDKGGFNIEGLCATPERTLLIGFRNPIPRDKALIVPLINPFEVIQGIAAQFDCPIELDLEGLGIRSLEYWPEQNVYLICAGSFDGTKNFKLYRWAGPGKSAELLAGIDIQDLNVEGIVTYPDNATQFQILSDDGSRLVDGEVCKDLEQSKQRRFRSAWITYPTSSPLTER
jgi:Protein of unknown function (DUF3616)